MAHNAVKSHCVSYLSPEQRVFMDKNNITDILESLLTSIAVVCPGDPIEYIIQCLQTLQTLPPCERTWDMFVPLSLRPAPRLVMSASGATTTTLAETDLQYIFKFDGTLENDGEQPSFESYVKAYSHRNLRCISKHFKGWLLFHLYKSQKQRLLRLREKIATTHYHHRIYRIHLHQWIDWMQRRRNRQAAGLVAYSVLHEMMNKLHMRTVVRAWQVVTLDARRTREYFERLERGDDATEEAVMTGAALTTDSMLQLENILAEKVFTYLSIVDLCRCAQVSRNWRVLAYSLPLWNKIDLGAVKGKMNDKSKFQLKVIPLLLKRARPHLSRLNLRSCQLVETPTFTAVSMCKNLQELNLSECFKMRDMDLQAITIGCPILLYLNLSYTYITDASMRFVSCNLANLQYLSIAYCAELTDGGLLVLANGENAPKLLHVDFSGCPQFTATGYQAVAESCHSLHTVLLNDISPLSSEAVHALLQPLKKLRHVSFLGSRGLTDQAMANIPTKALTTLKIESNYELSDGSMRLLSLAQHLNHLYLSDCLRLTDSALRHIISCANLTTVNISDCLKITDTGVKHICDSASAMKLRELNITNCVRVTDLSIVTITKRCPNLVYLNMGFLSMVTESGIELLGNMPKLYSLDLRGCENCTDGAFAQLALNPRLKQLSVNSCERITDLGLQKFAQHARQIEHLDLSYCAELTDASIKNLAFYCRLITNLRLTGCKLLTDLTLQYITGVCQYLAVLDVSACPLLTDKGIRHLQRAENSSLKILIMMYCRNVSKAMAIKLAQTLDEVQHSSGDPPPSIQVNSAAK